MEVISVGVLYYVAFIPCLVSAYIALDFADNVNGKVEGNKEIKVPKLYDELCIIQEIKRNISISII